MIKLKMRLDLTVLNYRCFCRLPFYLKGYMPFNYHPLKRVDCGWVPENSPP
jgi:hypothetical protein